MATFQIDMLKSIAPLESTRTSTTTPAPAKTHTPTDPGEVLENWSSLIGIVTAIIGNVLIALALNVQRYAHTRLHKERIRSRRRARAAIKRASHTDEGGFYGTIPAESDRRNPANGSADSRSAEDVSAFNESNPSYESFHSGSATDPDLLLEEGESKANSTYLKSPYWWLGQILITLGEMGNFLAYGFAPASIVSPLGVVALISNCIIAPVMFHERFRARDFWGVLIAVAGVVTVVFSANQEETKLEPHDVWESITTMGFEIYLGVTILLIIVLMWASGKYGKRTILIDLGLVGLFGMIMTLQNATDGSRYADDSRRRIYSFGDQRCFFYAIIDSLEGLHDPCNVCARLHSSGHGCDANSLRQQSSPTIRLDASHSDTICPLYTKRHLG